jgi:4-azaleucine resistance transporter AzlC
MTTDAADSPRSPATPDGSAVRFSTAGIRDGFVECLPVAVGVAGYGVVFGMLARRAGLRVAEAALMSATVLAGAAQLLTIELWETPVPVVAVVVTTLVVNLRYVLMGAALRPWLGHLQPAKVYGSVFFVADENWALTMGQFEAGGRQGAYLLGSGLAIWSAWVLATVVGAVAGGLIGEPARYGLDFVLTAVFLAIAVGLWEGRSSLHPWLTAIVVAVPSAQYLPGRWYILLGGVAGSLAGVLRVDG